MTLLTTGIGFVLLNSVIALAMVLGEAEPRMLWPAAAMVWPQIFLVGIGVGCLLGATRR